MCGIVGAIAERDVVAILVAGLKRLEYRGYDSAGLVVQSEDRSLQRLRALGKVAELEKALTQNKITGHLGLAHTRWATHGKPSEANAHPHVSGDEIAIVHNGIIENYQTLRDELATEGYFFSSETDTEIVAHLIHQQLAAGHELLQAVKLATDRLTGAFALGIIYKNAPDRLIAIRKGSPLVIGLGIGENFIASSQLALLPVTQRFIDLGEGELADVRRDQIYIIDAKGCAVTPKIMDSTLSFQELDRGVYRHFMLKEIFEQPQVLVDTLEDRLTEQGVIAAAFGVEAPALFKRVKHVQIVACGTSYHAGLIAKYWIEEIAGIACQVEIASEFRYRRVVVLPDTLFVTISQSGETADTIAALTSIAEHGYLGTLTICNVPESALVRASQFSFMTRAGVEIGVASTKAFTTQLTSLLMLALALGSAHNLAVEKSREIVKQLRSLPQHLAAALELSGTIEKLAEAFSEKQHTLFLGRGALYPVAMEGALKLKEISYIHAEAYPAGELKHGPLALVDKDMPVVTVAPNDELLEKLKSNLNEVKARGGQLFVFADPSLTLEPDPQLHVLALPQPVPKLLAPIVFTIPLQLLAYYAAVLKGTDVDQPRNLAKSVTVE